MKNSFFLIIILLCSISCNKTIDTVTSNCEQQSDLIYELSCMNDSLKLLIPASRLSDTGKRNFMVSCDASGALYGASQGGSLGFWIGFAGGNPALG